MSVNFGLNRENEFFMGPNFDVGVGSFVIGLVVQWTCRRHVTYVSESETSLGSKSDATSLIYKDGSNFCSNMVYSD